MSFFGCYNYLIWICIQPSSPPREGAIGYDIMFTVRHENHVFVGIGTMLTCSGDTTVFLSCISSIFAIVFDGKLFKLFFTPLNIIRKHKEERIFKMSFHICYSSLIVV